MTTTSTASGALRGPPVQPPRPDPCTYWVSDRLLAGEHPAETRGLERADVRLARYLDEGITVFIDLTQEGEKPSYEHALPDGIAYHRFAVPDFGVPPTRQLMKEILDAIDGAVVVARDKKVYVHCAGGIGRTGITVGCYLVRHGNGGTEALREVNRLFRNSARSMESPNSPETREQMDFVREWDESETSS